MGSDGKVAGRACPAPTAQPLLQLKIPNYQQLQACVRVGNKPLGLVQNGLFQRVAGHASVAVRGGVLGLLAVKVGDQRQLTGSEITAKLN